MIYQEEMMCQIKPYEATTIAPMVEADWLLKAKNSSSSWAYREIPFSGLLANRQEFPGQWIVDESVSPYSLPEP